MNNLGGQMDGPAPKHEYPPMKRYPSSGVSVLVIGGGIAGLGFAIEAFRKGHQIRLIERRPDFQDFGDIISIQSSGLHTPRKWPGFMERLKAAAFDPISYMNKYDGTPIGSQALGTPDHPSLPFTRSELHAILHEYTEHLGIPIEFSATATEYFETENCGGVVLADGRRLTADVVVAADGVGSKSWPLVLGYKEQAISSGFALYRATFPVGPVLENPIIAKEYEGFKNRISVYIGPGVHVVVGKTEKQICWVMTRADDGNAEEDWTKTASSDKGLELVRGWTPFLTELINSTPNHTATDWKLMWRNPQPRWASPEGRVIQIGDAAHAFLPASTSGATMGLEDAYSLAACLQLSGKCNIPLAVKVHNHLRFERVSCAQKMGFRTNQLFHNADWDAIFKNPKVVLKTVGDWILTHDPEQYAYDNYGNCANHILMGTPFQNTNAVPGYTYKAWTVKELLDAAARGEPIVDEGDWL